MNPTGIKPVEYKILIKVHELKSVSSGGIYIPDNVMEREQMAHDRGVLVDVGNMAFADWDGETPVIGDNVIYNKYAGTIIQYRPKDKPIERYRLCNDKDILAILKEEKTDG